MYGWYKVAPFSSSPLLPTTTSQLTCFSYFQDSRGEVKLALLPPCNLPLRHYHSTAAAPMYLSPRSFFSRGISAHITKMLFACSETLTNRVPVMNWAIITPGERYYIETFFNDEFDDDEFDNQEEKYRILNILLVNILT